MSDVIYLPSILRAMAKNYAGGHRWDHLDSEAVTKAADHIAALEAENARLRTGQEPVCPGCNGTGDGVDMGDCAQVACMCNGTGALTTPQPSAVPDGWKLVPVEPTEEMLESDFISCHCGHDFSPALFDHVWHKMLAAAPAAPATVVSGETVQGDALTGEYHADVNHLLGVNQKLLEALEELMYARTDKAEAMATAALAEVNK